MPLASHTRINKTPDLGSELDDEEDAEGEGVELLLVELSCCVGVGNCCCEAGTADAGCCC